MSATGRLKASAREVIKKIDNQQNDGNKQQQGLPLELPLAFEMVLDGFKQYKLKQESGFAGEYDAVNHILRPVRRRHQGKNGHAGQRYQAHGKPAQGHVFRRCIHYGFTFRPCLPDCRKYLGTTGNTTTVFIRIGMRNILNQL